MTRAIEGEKRKAEELENRLKAVRGGVMAERREMGGNNAPQEQNQAVQKQVKVLEHRLHRALVKFNEAIAANKDLREEIDNLRRERVVFDGIYKKLQHELGEKKRKMAEIIEVANVAYEARDRAQVHPGAISARISARTSMYTARASPRCAPRSAPRRRRSRGSSCWRRRSSRSSRRSGRSWGISSRRIASGRSAAPTPH